MKRTIIAILSITVIFGIRAVSIRPVVTIASGEERTLNYAIEAEDTPSFMIEEYLYPDNMTWQLSVEDMRGNYQKIATSKNGVNRRVSFDLTKLKERFKIAKPYDEDGVTVYHGKIILTQPSSSSDETIIRDEKDIRFHLGPDKVKILSFIENVGWNYSDNMMAEESEIVFKLYSANAQYVEIERYYPENINTVMEAETRTTWQYRNCDESGYCEALHICDACWGVIYGYTAHNDYGSSYPILINTRDYVTDPEIRAQMAECGAKFSPVTDIRVLIADKTGNWNISDGRLINRGDSLNIEVYSSSGLLVDKTIVKDEYSFNNLSRGIYIVKVSGICFSDSFKILI